MTSLPDSTAHFEDRCQRLGLNQVFVNALRAAGVESRLAFSVGQPGQPIQNQEVNDFIQRALGRAGAIAEASSVKRLTFEAHTYLVATLRQQVEPSDESQPRKVAYAERTQRMDALRADLRGIEISGEMEPAHSLLDKACKIFDDNSIKWLEPSTCVSRSMEVQGEPPNRVNSPWRRAP